MIHDPALGYSKRSWGWRGCAVSGVSVRCSFVFIFYDVLKVGMGSEPAVLMFVDMEERGRKASFRKNMFCSICVQQMSGMLPGMNITLFVIEQPVFAKS